VGPCKSALQLLRPARLMYAAHRLLGGRVSVVVGGVECIMLRRLALPAVLQDVAEHQLPVGAQALEGDRTRLDE
jgi:hypothetical protein